MQYVNTKKVNKFIKILKLFNIANKPMRNKQKI